MALKIDRWLKGSIDSKIQSIEFRNVFREIGQFGRNQATVMRICHQWIQEETADLRGRSQPPHLVTPLPVITGGLCR
ncbi:hypothetical protein TNCV_3514761 [Trichonephila clavipes]|nr:hypothetical protein TNCV_3514761 [Trichonephila clavipes]